MKFKEYLESLNEMAKDDPTILELEVISAKDDEGNGFQKVSWTPTVGMVRGLEDYYFDEFHSDKEDYEEYYEEEFKPNSICIN